MLYNVMGEKHELDLVDMYNWISDDCFLLKTFSNGLNIYWECYLDAYTDKLE